MAIIIIHLYRLHVQIACTKRKLLLIKKRVYPEKAGLLERPFIFAKEHHGTRLVRLQLHIAGKQNEPYQTQTHRKDQGRHRNEKSKDYHRRKHYQMKEQGQKAIHLETTETTLFCFHIL